MNVADIGNEAAKSLFPVTITSTSTIMGVQLPTLVLIGTLGYIMLQAAYLVYKWRNEHKDRKKDD